MKKNMGTIDRIIRIIVAIIIAILYITQVINGTVALVLLALAGIGWHFYTYKLYECCPLYLPFGINTNGKKK